MVILKGILIYFRLNKVFLKSVRLSHNIHDRYYDYFRNKNEYKNSLIQLNDDCRNSALNGPQISFINKQDVEVDKFFSHLLRRENVMQLSTSQLKDMMHLMANAKIDSVKYENALMFFDEKCALSVDRWPLDLSLYVLDAWLIILGPKAFRKHYYFALSNLLNRKMKKCSKYDLLLVLYFLGISKKSPPFLMELIKYKMEQFVLDLTNEEWAIACLSFFKISKKMNSDLLLKQSCKAAENLMLKNDNFNLISILKCLRLSDYFDINLMTLLDNYIETEYKKLNFVECTNFLASFASQNIYNCRTFMCLEDQGMSQLENEDTIEEFDQNIKKIHPSERSRVKDLARFLWAMAFVGHNINQKTLNFMVHLLNSRLSAGEFESNLPALIDCTQSLILFGHYPLNIIHYVLNPVSLQKISHIEQAKPKYQLYFISRSAYIENHITEIETKKFLNNIPKSLQKEIMERKGFVDLIDFLNANLKESSFKCCYIMPHIMISGIFVAADSKGNNYGNLVTSTLLKYIDNGIISKNIQSILHENKMYTCIELLDSSVCVHGSTMPLGLMKTKICHLQKLNINVITLSTEEINMLTKSKEQTCSKLQDLIF